MNNYKYLIPILLVAMLLGSFYMLIDSKKDDNAEYQQIIDKARDYKKQEIYVDATRSYMLALDKRPSLELSLEIGNYFLETAQIQEAHKWGESLLEEYANEVSVYEYQMRVLDAEENYAAVYALGDVVHKRNLQSKAVEEVLERHRYQYFFNSSYKDVGAYSNGFYPVMAETLWGYADRESIKVIPHKYTFAGPFIDELAPVVDKDGKAFYIDTAGNKKMVVQDIGEVEQLGAIHNGFFSAKVDGKWNIYDETHKQIFGGFDDATYVINGITAVKKDNKWTIRDMTGKDLTGKTYKKVAADDRRIIFRNDRIFAAENYEYEMIDTTGKVIGNQKYDDVHIFNDGTYAAVQVQGLWGFVDNTGKMVIKPQFENARSFANGYAAVSEDGLWGFIDTEGKMVIPAIFDDARDFSNGGNVFVKQGEEWNLLRLYSSNH